MVRFKKTLTRNPMPTLAVIAGPDPQSHNYKDDSCSNKTNTPIPSPCNGQREPSMQTQLTRKKGSCFLVKSGIRLHLMRLRVKVF